MPVAEAETPGLSCALTRGSFKRRSLSSEQSRTSSDKQEFCDGSPKLSVAFRDACLQANNRSRCDLKENRKMLEEAPLLLRSEAIVNGSQHSIFYVEPSSVNTVLEVILPEPQKVQVFGRLRKLSKSALNVVKLKKKVRSEQDAQIIIAKESRRLDVDPRKRKHGIAEPLISDAALHQDMMIHKTGYAISGLDCSKPGRKSSMPDGMPSTTCVSEGACTRRKSSWTNVTESFLLKTSSRNASEPMVKVREFEKLTVRSSATFEVLQPVLSYFAAPYAPQESKSRPVSGLKGTAADDDDSLIGSPREQNQKSVVSREAICSRSSSPGYSSFQLLRHDHVGKSFHSDSDLAGMDFQRKTNLKVRCSSFQENGDHFCGSDGCKDLLQETQTKKLCHHFECQEKKNLSPLLLCCECDAHAHCEDRAAHERLELPVAFKRRGSIRSTNSDSGHEEDEDFKFDKSKRSYASARRFFMSAARGKSRMKKHQGPEDTKEESFTVQLHVSEDDSAYDTETAPAVKGTSLRDAIEPMFRARGLTFDTHSVFLDSSQTPLPLAFDTFPLGGNVLHVRANRTVQVDERILAMVKDENKKVAGIASGGPITSQRSKKGSGNVVEDAQLQKFNSPTVLNNSSNGVSNAGKFTYRRSAISGSGGKEVSRSLSELLSYYGQFGLEVDDERFVDEEEAASNFYFLEASWTELIATDASMTKKQLDQQEAIWELLSTECAYIKKLRVIIKVFQLCLKNLQQDGFLLEVDGRQLFSNIDDVFAANDAFWREYLRQCVEEARSSRAPIQPSQLLDSFAKFEDLFEPYMHYCMEEAQCVKYLKDMTRTCEGFPDYLQWCENHKICNRLKLTDLLVKPMQRVTKYPLLLRAVLKKTSDENERLSLTHMISQVERFVSKINTALRVRHEQQKLEAVLERVESYNPVEAATDEVERIISDMSSFNMRSRIPGLAEDEQRCVLLEGPMKMVEKQGRNDVYAFLFTDMFLLTKLRRGGEKLRVIRQPFRLNKMLLHVLRDAGSFLFIYLNEYNMLATAFVLQVSPAEQVKWMGAMERAKKFYMNARAGHGSTLDYFYDDDPLSHAVSESSPMPDRREGPFALACTELSGPSIVVSAEDLALKKNRLASIEAATDQPVADIPRGEKNIKRSSSDSRYHRQQHEFDKRRPVSLIVASDKALDHDTASWVLTNETRDRSGSIPSDLSNDSRQTSGIGDSFRSINSDSAVFHDRRKDTRMRQCYSYPEVSNVAKLKAKFERCQSPDSTDGSNSSISSAPTVGISDPVATAAQVISAAHARWRATPPGLAEEKMIIPEEDEHPQEDSSRRLPGRLLVDRGRRRSCGSVDAAEEADVQHNDDTLSLTISEGASTLTCVKYKLTDGSRKNSTVVRSKPCAEQAVQVECRLDVVETGAQCDAAVLLERGAQCDAVFLLDVGCQCDGVAALDAEIQCDVYATRRSNAETQCAVTRSICRHVASQCGDLVCMSDKSLSEPDEGAEDSVCCVPTFPDAANRTSASDSPGSGVVGFRSSSDSVDSASELPPLLKLQGSSTMPSRSQYFSHQSSNHKQRGNLRLARSEASLPVFFDGSDQHVSHARSSSDVLQPVQIVSLASSPGRSKRSTTGEFPGMRALQTLSESLESFQSRSFSAGSRACADQGDTEFDSVVPSRKISSHSQPSASPSLHRFVPLKSPPKLSHKHISTHSSPSASHRSQSPHLRSCGAELEGAAYSWDRGSLSGSARDSMHEQAGTGSASSSSSSPSRSEASESSGAARFRLSGAASDVARPGSRDRNAAGTRSTDEVVAVKRRSKVLLWPVGKRNTWHFNSSVDNQLDLVGEPSPSSALDECEKMSLSTQVLSPTKKESFRKALVRRFADSRLLHGSEASDERKARRLEKRQRKEQKDAEKRVIKAQQKLDRSRENEIKRSTTMPTVSKPATVSSA